MKTTLRAALSLVLALMMCAALAVPASARSFADEDDISDSYVSNVTLLASLGIIDGVEGADGSASFKPGNSLTREEAAKIMAFVLLGSDIDSLAGYYERSGCRLTDIESSWARDYIAYCCDNGIVNGDGSGCYFPQQTLSIAQTAKLLLSTAGYNDEGRYTGANWNSTAMRDAASAGLFAQFGVAAGTGSLEKGEAACSREQFCSMAAITLAKLCMKNKDATLGSEAFNMAGALSGEVSAITASGATVTGQLTSDTVMLRTNAGGSATAQRQYKTVPVSLTVPVSGKILLGSQISFMLRGADSAAMSTLAGALKTAAAPAGANYDAPIALSLGGAGDTLSLNNGTLSAKVTTPVEGAIVSSSVIAGAADLSALSFAETVKIYRNDKLFQTLSASAARSLCEGNSGAELNLVGNAVASVVLPAVSAGSFPTTCIYYGEYAMRIDSDGQRYWEMEVYGEGETRIVDVYELTIVGGSSSTISPDTSSDPNTSIRSNLATPIADVKKADGWACALRLRQGINEKLSATFYGSGSSYPSALYRVAAYDGKDVLLTTILPGGTDGGQIEAVISDEYYGGCYDLRGSSWGESELARDEYVLAFYTLEGSKNYVRAAYIVELQ